VRACCPAAGRWQPALQHPARTPGGPIEKHAVRAGSVLNEAYDYPKPFVVHPRHPLRCGRQDDAADLRTASIDDAGETVHPGDFRAQLWRTYRNISALLESEGATWHDIVRTTATCGHRAGLRDFNEVRRPSSTARPGPLPASTGIQARLCVKACSSKSSHRRRAERRAPVNIEAVVARWPAARPRPAAPLCAAGGVEIGGPAIVVIRRSVRR